ncbi:MAG TPA: hypothetical protein DCR17_07205 [Verrucomicrobiales bacterium]|nr:hypothetical protein [Pedosphaera sp.]HAO66457.1 hypothetical protein [Verrucomicrobiales bacterium]HBP56877.1 hypothetical protein [Verrucomicrobiales bacterium]HCP37351.1 hypothetical protein [Verrucomicrobiales bacterium]HCZ04176.1 hypothetical protein [Verrucomicrobiales bacterium]
MCASAANKARSFDWRLRFSTRRAKFKRLIGLHQFIVFTFPANIKHITFVLSYEIVFFWFLSQDMLPFFN